MSLNSDERRITVPAQRPWFVLFILFSLLHITAAASTGSVIPKQEEE